MKKLLLVFPIVALLAAGCGASQQAANQAPVVQNTAQPSLTNTSTTTPPTPSPTPMGWKTYSDTSGGFQISYPPDWKSADESARDKARSFQDSYKLQANEFVLSAPGDSGWRTIIRSYSMPMTQVVNAITKHFTFPLENNSAVTYGKTTSSSQKVTIGNNEWNDFSFVYFNQPGSGLQATSSFETLLKENAGVTYEFNGDYNGSDPKFGNVDTNIFNSLIITK